ncbi:MAG TPA: hypothetical protein VLB07_09655 [Woeseiaceae bacterium]|nr:hypothetical protein [Woeseiaceae bacterium]
MILKKLAERAVMSACVHREFAARSHALRGAMWHDAAMGNVKTNETH